MEEEDTRELLLPNWKGSGTMGLTLDQNAEGVYVKQLVQNSPAAKTGVVREGDQVVGATVYFDNMSSEDIEKLLANVGQHTVGLKLHRKGDRSPQPGVTYSHDVFSLKSPDVVLSGDDEEYRRIYTKKIKPRLKSEDGLEPETQTRTITVTRKVTAYTVDVTGSKDTKEIDISSPEYKIKIPRHEITEISKTSVETEEGKTMIRIPGIDVSGKSRQTSGEYSVSLPGDTMNVHTTTVRYQGQSGAQFEYPEGELSRQTSAGIHLPDISVSGPKFQSYEKKIDVKMSRFGAEHDFGLRDPNFRGASEDIGLEVKTPDYNASTAAGNIKESQGTGSVTSRIGFQTSSTTIKGAKFDIKSPEVRIPETDINISSTQSVGPKLDEQFKLSHSSRDGLAATGAHMDITPGFEGKAITSNVNLAGPTVDFKGTDIELENSGGKINIPSFKVPKFGFSETSKEFSQPDLSLDGKSEKWAVKVPKIDMPKVSIDTKGSSGRMETEVSDIGLQRDLNFGVKGPQIKIATEVGQGHVETTEVGAVEGNIKMPKFNLPRFGVPESKLEGGINLSGPQADLVSGGAIDLKGPSVDVKTPSLDITSQVGSVDGGHLTKPSVSVSLPKIPKPDMDVTLKGPKGIDISKPKVNITGPTVETEVKDISIGGRVENVKFEVPPVQLPKAKVDLKGPTIEGNLEALTGSIKVPNVDIAVPKVDLGASEGKISMPKFKMPKFGISDSNFERPQVDVNLPKVDVNTIDAKMDVDGSTHSVNVSLPKVPEVDLGFKGPKLDGKLKSPTFGIKSTEADLQAPDLNLGGKVKGPILQMQGVSLPKVSMSDLDLNVKGPTFEKDLKAPKVDIKVPEVGLEGKMKGPNFQLPSLNMPDSDLSLKGPKISVPSVDLNLTGSKLGGGVKGPNVEIKGPKMPMPNVDLHLQGPKLESDLKGEIKCPDVEIKAPEVNLEAPDINIKDPEGKIKMPKFKMPKFGSKAEVNLKGPEFDIKAPEVELGSPNVDVDLNLKSPKVKGDIKGPKVQVKAPELDIDLPDIDTEGKVRDSKFKIPSMNFPDVSMDLKGPNWKGGAKGSLPKVEGEVEGPNADINIPDIDTGLKIEGPEGKIKMPKFKMPSFGFSGQNVEGPEGDISLPKAELDLSVPDVDIEAPEIKVKGSKFKMPSMNFNLPKKSKHDVDLNIKGPSIEGDLKVPKVEVKAPVVEPEALDFDLEGKVKGPKFKMPSVNFQKVSMPEVDLNLKGPNWKGGAEVSLPKAEGDIKGLGVDLKGPELDAEITGVDIEGPEGKIKIPKFKMPKFGISGHGVKSTEMDVNIPKADMEVSGPEFDIAAPDAKVKGSKFKMPSMNFNLPKISKPDLGIKGPKIEGDVDIKAPEVDIEAPDFDGKVKGPKFKMPSVNIPKMPDLHLKGPKLEGDVKCPDVDIEGPKIDLEGPDVDLDGKVKGSKFKMPSVNLPSMPDFHLKGPKLEGDVKGPKIDIKGPAVDLEGPDVDLDGKVKGPKFKMPSVNLPSMPDFHLKGPKLEGDVKGPKVDIKGPEVDLECPDVDLDGKVKGPKLKMPSVNLPSMPDFNLKGPKLEGDVKGPKIDIKGPDVDLEGPDVDLDGKVKGPKFKMPSVNLPSMPDFHLKGPKLEGDVKGPKIDIKGPAVDLEGPDVDLDGKVKGPKFKMPSINLPSMPDFHLKGPKLEGDVKGPKVDIKGPEVDLECPDVDLDGKVKGPKFKMPSVNLPSMPDFHLKGPKLEGDVKGPNIDIKGPEVDLEGPDVDLDGKVKGPKFKMPSINLPSMPDFHLKGPKLEGDVKGPKVDIKGPEVDLECPDVDLDGKVKGPKFKMPSVNLPSMPDFHLKGPKLEGDVKGPKIDIKGPEVDLEGPDVDLDGKVKGPKLKMPSVNLPSMPDFHLKGPKLEGDVKGPKVDIKGPEVDLECPDVDLDGKVKGPKFKMPSVNLPSMPDFHLKGPKLEGDVKGPKVDIKGPEVDLEGPDVDLDGKVKGPKFKMPSVNLPSMPDFHLKGPKLEGDVKGPKIDIKGPEVDLEGPDVDLDGKVKGPKLKMPSVNLPSMPDFHLKGPKLEGDVKGPKVDIKGPEVDLECPDVDLDGKVKGPKFKMPSVNLPSMPDFHLKGPKLEGDVKGPKVDIKGPEVDLEGPDVDLDGKVKGPKFKMPSVNLPKMPDLHLKGPKLEGDVKGPKVDIKGPEVDLECPDVDLDGKVKGPKFKMPSVNLPSMPDFHLKGPKLEGDVKGPKVDIKGPEVDLEGPDVDLDGKVKGPKFKMPSVNLPSMPDFHLKGPKLEGDVKGPKVDIKGPEVDLEGPDVDLDGKVKGPKFKMPSVNLPSMPDFHLKGPKLEGDVKGPKVDIKGPEVDLEGPDVDLDGKVKGPKFKMPSVNLPSMPDFHLKGPKLEGDVKGPKVDIKGPEVDLEGPDVDLDGKVKGPKFKMPSINLPKMPDLHLKGPKLEGDVKCPDVDIEGPKVDLEGPDVDLNVKGKSPKFKMPSVNLPKVSLPDVDLKGPNWKGKAEYELPKVEGELKSPEINLGMADVDIESPEGKLKMPKFKMPKFGISGGNIEGDANLPKADIEVSGPDIEMDADGKVKGPKFKMPSMNINVPDIDLKGPKMKVPSLDMNMPKISMPDIDLNLKGPKLKAGADIEGGTADIKLPKLEGDLEGAGLDLEVPSGNLETSDGKLKMPKFKMPKFGFSGPSAEMSGVDVGMSGPKLDIKTPELGVEIPEGKVKSPKIKIPDVDLSVKGPNLKGGVDAKLQADIKNPNIDIKGPELNMPSPSLSVELPEGKVKGSKFKLPSWGFSKPSVSMPDVDLSLKGPKVKGDLDVTAKGGSLKGPELGVGVPDIDIDLPEAKVKKSKFRLPKFNFSGSKSASVDIKVPKTDIDISGPDMEVPNLTAKGKSPKFKMPSLNITSPKVSVPDVELNVKGPQLEGDFKGPKVDINSPKIEAPEVEIDGKVKGPKFKLPSMHAPNISMPDVDLSLKAPNFEGGLKGPNVDIKGPECDVQGPDFELEAPDVNLKGPEGKFKMPKFKMPKFGMSGKGDGLDIDASLPKGEIDISCPNVDIKAPEVDIEGPEGKLKGPNFKLPSMDMHLPKVSMPDIDFNLKGPKLEGGVKGPKVDIKGPEADLDLDVDGKVKGPKFKLPTMHMPNISMPDVDLNLKGPNVDGGLKGPNVDIKGPECDVQGPDFELEAPDVNLKGPEGKFKMPKFKMPKFGMSGKGDGLDIDASLPKGEIDISCPNVDIKAPEVDIEGPEGKLKGPNFKLPSMDMHLPKVSMPDIDFNLKGPKLEGGVKGPKVDIKGPEADLDLDVDGKVKGPKFKLPTMHVPKISMPDVDLNLKGPSVEGGLKGPNVDIKGPECDVQGPDFELEAPDVNLKGPEGKFKMPKFKMPKFGMSGKGDGLDIDASLPKGEIDISCPNVDMKAPEVDIEGPEGKLKGPNFKLPSMDMHLPKVSMPDIDFNLKGPKLEGGVKGPKVDIKGPEADLDLDLDGKVKGPKFKLPTMHVPKISMPDVDLNLKGPNVEGGLKGPNVDIKGPECDVQGPDFELEAPDVNLKGPEGKFKMPKFKMPKFGMSGKGDGLDIDASLPKGEIDISCPNVDMKAPEVDIEGPEGKLKGPNFKLPSMDMHLPKVSMPDIDFNLKGPKLEGGVKGPKVDIKGPEADLDLDGKVKGPKFKLPTMHVPKISMPDVDLNLKGPNVEGGLKGPNVDIKGPECDVQGPDFELEAPDVNLKGPEGKFKMPKFKMPKFGMSGKGDGLDIDASLPKGEIDISCPNVDIKAPEVDIEGPEGKLKGPNFKLPSMDMHLPKVSMPDIDFNLKSPKVEGGVKGPKVDIKGPEADLDVDGKVKGPKFKLPTMHVPKISMPDVDLNLKGPNVEGGLKGPNVDIKGPECDVQGPDFELEAPDVNLKGPEGKFKMPKFKMPKFGMSGKGDGLDIDASLPKGEIDISCPNVDIKAPEVDIEGPEGKLKGPNFKLPSMDMHLPKVSMPDIDFNFKGPKVEGGVKGPKVDIKGPEADLDLDGKVKGPKFKLPTMHVPKISMPDVDLNLKGPNVEGGLKGPNVDIEGPECDVQGPDFELEAPDVNLKGPEGKFKMPKFKMPKFGMSGKGDGLDIDASLPKGEIDISCPNVDIKAPEVDIEGPEGKLKGPNFKLPSMDMHLPKVSMPDIDFNLKGPKLEGGVKGPKVDIKGPEADLDLDVDGKVKGPKFKLPTMHVPKISMPDVDLNLKGPNVEGGLKGPNVDIKGPECDVQGPDFELEAPDLNLKGPEGKFKMPKFKMPKFGMSGKGDGLDIDASLPKGKIDISCPNVDMKAPEVDIEGPEGKLKGPNFKLPSMDMHLPKVSMPDIDFNFKGPKVEGGVKGPKVDIKGPEADLDLDVDGKVKGPKFKLPTMHVPKISMPDVDLNLKGPNVEGGLKGPNVDIKGPECDVQGPDFELEAPDVNLKGPEGKFKMPKFKMPTFGMSGKGDGLDIDASLPKGEIDISCPNVDIKAPEVDIEGPEGKLKGPNFKLPSMDIHLPKVSMPDLDLNLKGPKVDGGANVGIKTPELDVDGKVKGSKFKMPSLNLPDVSLPEVSLKGPKFKGDMDLSGPTLEGDINVKSPNLKGDLDVTGPKLEGDLKIPAVDVDVDIPEGSLKLPKVKKPKFGFGIKSPKAEVKASSVDVNVPEVDFDAEIPEVSVSGKGKKGKFKMPKIHMSGPKVKGKKAGFDVNAPDMDNDINLNAPDVDLNVSGGDAGIKTDIGLKAPKTRKPLFGKIHFPDVEFDIKSPKLKGDASLQSPKADIKTPDLEIGGGVKVPDVDLTTSAGSIEGPDIKMKKTKFKLPGFSMSGPKVEVPEADLSLSKGNIDLSGPKIDIGTSGTMSIKNDLPNLSIDTSAPQISVPDIDVNLQGPKFKAEKVGSINVDLNSPNLGISGSTGKISLPEVGITGSSTGRSEINFDTKLKTPNLDGSIEGPSIKTPAVDITLPKVTGPEIDTSFKGPKIEGDFGSSSGIDLPGINVKGASSRVELSGPQVKLPKGEFSLSRPEAEISGSTGVSGLNLKGPLLNVSGQDINLKGDLSGGAGYLQGPSGLRIQGTKVEGDLTGPKVEGGWNVKPIDLNLEGSSGKITFPRLLMPKFTTSEPEPSGREVGVDVDFPSANVQLAKPGQADVDLESDIKIKKSKIKMPKLNFKSKGKVDANLPDVSVSGAKGELQSSKASLGSVEGGVGSATLEVDKPAKYEFSLFTSKKTRHRSSSLSEEKDESTHSSPSGTLDAGASLSAEGGKKKGKHSKIKFGTFGGLGSKSKGSYEVTLSDDENVQGSGASLSSRKSRVSSSSSNDSATKAGVRLPKVELTVAKKKE
ncbi:neuroblast differentiation-associated protein AHNAK isoform X3 [Engystomops pustulosus]|uniref:neuroblast differentiation-associated protein AHNAK isoform X3 n=1 Tax=Engystomops pustulosus TaxID=76066 RepID=UPI003AFAD340